MSSSIGNPTSKLPPKPLIVLSNNPSVLKQQMNSSQTGPISRLHQYFASSQYLSSQEELSIFIENFPIIDIEASHKSINDILPLLIRQNELLGKKCQSQVMLIKESFTKHQAINKLNKKLKEEVQTVQVHCRQIISQKQAQTIETIKISDGLSGKIKAYEQFINCQNSILTHLLNSEYKKCEELTNARNIRIVYDQFITVRKDYKTIDKQPQLSIKSEQNHNSSQQLISLQQIERYCREQRRRNKYYQRVKSSVEQFCVRLVKITTVVPIQMVSQELSHECAQFIDIIADLINAGQGNHKKRREESLNHNNKKDKNRQSEKSREGNHNNREREKSRQRKLNQVNSESSLMSKSELQAPLHNYTNNNNQASLNSNLINMIRDKQSTVTVRPSNQSSSFQGILSTYVNQSTKKYQQTIQLLQVQIQELKKQLQTSKTYYQNYLINAKLQYESSVREQEEQVTIKDEMCKHYQQELANCFTLKEQLQNRVVLVSKQNEDMKKRQNPLKHEIQQLKQQLQLMGQSLTKAVNKNKTIEQSLNEQAKKKQSQLTEIITKLQHQLKSKQQEHQEQITKKQSTIKHLQQQLTTTNQQLRTLKQLIQDKNIELNRVTKRLHAIQQDQVRKLQSQVSTIQQEIATTKCTNTELTNTVKQLQQELALNKTYSKELQAKCSKQQQAIEKLNKKLSSAQIQNKSLKLLQTTNNKLQHQIQLSGQQLKKTQQDNFSLKKLVKQMKKQLQEVYKTINDLKSIQKQRQKLVLQNQKSQRWKEQIMKDYDQMKFQILKVQAENKTLSLQVRHYKNALKRIQMIH